MNDIPPKRPRILIALGVAVGTVVVALYWLAPVIFALLDSDSDSDVEVEECDPDSLIAVEDVGPDDPRYDAAQEMLAEMIAEAEAENPGHSITITDAFIAECDLAP